MTRFTASGLVRVQITGSTAINASPQVVAAPPPPPAPDATDVSTRIASTSVVWHHRFEREEEITRFLVIGDVPAIGVPLRRTRDGGQWCLEQVCLGGELAAPYTAGGTTMQLVDAYLWPDPAVTGPFYFMAAKPYPTWETEYTKNLFLCTARSGTTLTVQWVAPNASGNAGERVATSSTFAQTAQSYPAGSTVGNETESWRRPFSALRSTENGKLVNDQAASGAVPVRSLTASDPVYGVPRDNAFWGYGYYGHPDYQALHNPWQPYITSTQYTARGGTPGTKGNPWDGSEFWIQYEDKLDSTYYDQMAMPNPNASFWGRKAMIVETADYSVAHQLVTGIGPGNTKVRIPSTNAAPWQLSTDKASRTIGDTDWDRHVAPSHRSLQPNSAWDVSPWFAYPEGPNSVGNAPSTGLNTPDGSAAWERPAGRWLSWTFRVRPGHSVTNDTLIEVYVADVESGAYVGSTTLLMSLNDVRLRFGLDKVTPDTQYLQANGVPTNPPIDNFAWLPGYSAFSLFGYFNYYQSWNSDPPVRRSYSYRMRNVLFSRSPIAPPLPEVRPSYLPSTPNTWLAESAGGGVLLNNFRTVINDYCWPTSVRSVNDFGQSALNTFWGQYGALIFHGGGHASGNDNSVWALDIGRTTMQFKRIVNCSPFFGTGTDDTTRRRNSDSEGGQGIYYPAFDATTGEVVIGGVHQVGVPHAPHTYDTLEIIGPAHGGAPHGTLLTVVRVEQTFGGGTYAPQKLMNHKVDFTSTAGATSSAAAGATRTWQRWSNTDGGSAGSVPSVVSAFVARQNRVYWAGGKGPGVPKWFDLTTNTYNVGTGTPAVTFGGATNTETMVYIESLDLLIMAGQSPSSATFSIQYMRVRPSDTQPSWASATLSLSIPQSGNPTFLTWCEDNQRLILGNVFGDANCVYEIAIPTTLTSPWTAERVAFTPPSGFSWPSFETWAVAWHYNPRIKALIYIRGVNSGFAPFDGNDTVFFYRPRGV